MAIKSFATFWALSLILLLNACSGDIEPFQQAVEASALDIQRLQIQSLRDHSQRGESLQYSAIALLADGSNKDLSDQVRWQTSDRSLATITQTGKLTTLGNGVISVSAAFSSLTASSTLTINDATLSSLRVSHANDLEVCKSQLLSATGQYDDGTEREIRDLVNWSLSPASIGTITNAGASKGLFSSTSSGNATLTASKGTVTGQALGIVQDNLQSIQLSAKTTELAIDKKQQYQAQGNYAGNSSSEDISSNVTWSSSSTTIATINSSGQVTTLTAGNTTIQASCGGKTGQQTLTVTDSSTGRLQFLFNDKIVSSLSRDDDSDFSLTLESVSNDNLTTKDVTEDANWSIQQPDSSLTVSVSNTKNSKGEITVTGSGSFTVKATLDDLKTLLQVDIKNTIPAPPPAL